MMFEHVWPEIVALGIFLVLFTIDMLKPSSSAPAGESARAFGALSTLGIAGVLAATYLFRSEGVAFSDLFRADAVATYLKLLFASIAGVIMIFAPHFLAGRKERIEPFLLIVWIALIGMFFLASSNDFFMAFLSVEIVTLSFYIMAAYLRRDILSIEAGLKYLIMGSLASAFMIFGIGLLYTAAGSTQFSAVAALFQSGDQKTLVYTGLLMVLSGIGFKIGSVPFHLWVADVYEGAPVPSVAYLSTASKAAGFAFFLRVLTLAMPGWGVQWTALFALLAVMTLIYGNFGALSQHSLRRLLGYSGIGHAGYLLIGIAAGQAHGFSAVLFYLAAYAVSNLTVFGVITVVEKATGSGEITAYSGLAKRSPFLAACLFIALMSLAGVPPTAGFFGKFLVLLAAVQSGLGWLALVGLGFVVVSLYYYLNVIRVMYSGEASDQEPLVMTSNFKLILSLLATAVLLLGCFQSPLYSHLVSLFS